MSKHNSLSRTPLKSKIRTFLVWYGATVLGFILIILVVLLTDKDIQSERILNIFWLSIKGLLSATSFYLVSLIPYIIFVLLKSLFKDFKNRGWPGLLKGVSLKTITPVIFIWGSLQLIDEYRFGEQFEYEWDRSVENRSDSIRNSFALDQKQRGMHVMDLESDTTDLEILKVNNVEWLTFVPFISQQDYDTPSLSGNSGPRGIKRRLRRWQNTIELADKYGFKVMVKPHIWLNNRPGNVWRSSIRMTNEEDWQKWFNQYSTFILAHARIAETVGAEQFCVGTELNVSVMEKPELWLELIKEVRKVYSGKLTYAANWDDDLEDIQLWDALDFIGIQAYFPVAKRSAPDLEELEAGWKSHYPLLEALNQKFNKPILFTEIGYKTTRNAGKEPWEWDTFNHRFYKRISHKTQALCYEAFFNTVWQQPWFAGAHVWEWQARGTSDGNNNSFTLEGKPALNVLAKGYR